MSLSPSPQDPVSRYFNRYDERFKSLADSPPRESLPPLKNSPLRPSYKDAHLVFEGEKYTSYEIQNEDCGEWRESKVLSHSLKEEVVSVKDTNERPKSPSQPKAQQQLPSRPATQQQKTAATEQNTEKPAVQQQIVDKPGAQKQKEPVKAAQKKVKKVVVKKSSSNTPQYMQATASFYNKAHSKKESRQMDNVLRPRTQAVITKRIGASKIPRQAIKEMKNEMKAKDEYVPMAARVKLYEKCLGNGSNTTNNQQTLPAQQKPSLSRQSSSTQLKPTLSRQSSSTSIPRYAQQTSITMIRQRERERVIKPMKRTPTSKEPKPFHFATNDRASRYNRSKQTLIENDQPLINNNKGIKRKNKSRDTQANQKIKLS